MTPRQKEPEQQELLSIPDDLAQEIEEYERWLEENDDDDDEQF